MANAVDLAWNDLDAALKWQLRGGKTADLRTAFETADATGIWRVKATRGIKGSGNSDLVVYVENPSTTTREQPDFKGLLADVAAKTERDEVWTKSVLLPALIRVVVFGERPGSVTFVGQPLNCPGYPPVVLAGLWQTIALTEWRKYRTQEPFGGRYLALRLAVGVAYRTWTSDELSYGMMK